MKRVFLLSFLAMTLASYASMVTKTIEFGQVTSSTEKSDYDAGQMADGSNRMLVIYSGGTNTSTKLTAADDGYNSTLGASKLSCTTNKGSKLKSGNKSHIRFTAIAGEKVRLYYFSSSALGKIHTFYLSHTTSAYDQQIEGNATCETGDKKLYYVDFTIPATDTFYISVNGGLNTAQPQTGTPISISGIRFEYQQAGQVIASAQLTGEKTCIRGGWYGDSIQNQVNAKGTNSKSEDITVTYEGKKGYCLNGAGNYVGVAVSGTTFKAGDVVSVFVTKVGSNGRELIIYSDAACTDSICSAGGAGVLGNNLFTLPAAAEGKTTLFAARKTKEGVTGWNGCIYSMEVRRSDIPYDMLFGYTWTAASLTSDLNSEFTMVDKGIVRAGTAVKGVNGSTNAMTRTSKDGVNMLNLNKKDNYIELVASESFQDLDEIEILGYAGGEDERGLYIEPNTISEYSSNSTTALPTNTFTGRVLHTSYKATLTEEWLTANKVTDTLRIFCSGKTIGVEKIDIIRHAAELQSQAVESGSINSEALTTERIDKLNASGNKVSLSGAYHANIQLRVKQTYTIDGDPSLTRDVYKDIILTEGEVSALDSSTTYSGTVGAITYQVKLKPFTPTEVTGGKTWDWSNLVNETYELTENTMPAKNEEFVMASVTGKFANFNAQNLIVSGQYASVKKNNGNTSDKVMCFVGNKVKFTTTQAGIVRATWVSNGATERVLTINGEETSVHSSATTDEFITTEDIYVEAGEVVIQCKLVGSDEGQYFRLKELKFQLAEKVTIRSNVTAGKYGTVCWPKSMISVTGATLYDIEKRDESSITLIEHTGAVAAGMPCIFEAKGGDIEAVCKGEEETTPLNNNGLYGTLEAMTAGSLTGNYFIQNNTVKACNAEATLAANRAYIVLNEISTGGSSAPGRRLTLGVPRGTATDLEAVRTCKDLERVLINGTIYILREGKMYDMNGNEMK